MVGRRKNRLTTDALREVRNTFSRFLSILILSALAVAFLAGLRTTAPDMQYTADGYYDRTDLMDGYVVSTLGLTDEDLEALEDAEGIGEVEGIWTIDAIAKDAIVTVRSMPVRLNRLEVEEGRLPETADECVTERLLLAELGLQIGDRLELAPGEDNKDDLSNLSYTIVGIVNSPLYVSTDRGTSSLGGGSVDGFVFIPGENFNYDYYTMAYFTGEGLRELDSYGDVYQDRLDALTDSLEGLADERAQIRYASVTGDAQKEIDDAQAELDDARQELDDARADAEKELADAEQELADARQELDDGWEDYREGKVTYAREIRDAEADLADAYRKLRDGEQELADGKQEYADGMQEFQDAQAEYEDGVAEYEDGKTAYEDGLQEYEDGLQEYEDGLQKYEDGEAQYADGKKQYDDGWSQYISGQNSLNDGIAEYESGLEKYAAGREQYEQGLAAYEENAAKLEAGQAQWEAGKAEYESKMKELEAGQAQLAQGRAELEKQQASYDEQKANFDQFTAANPEFEGTLLYNKWKDMLDKGAAELDSGREELDRQQAILDAGVASAADAKRQLDDAEATLQDGFAQLSSAQAQLQSAESELSSAGSQLSAAQSEIESGRAQLDESKKELDDAKKELEDSRQELDDAKQELDDSRQELDDAKQELDDSQQELDDAEAELADGKSELDDAWQELEDARIEIEDGEKELADGWAEYHDGERELADARVDGQKELDDALAELTDGEKEYHDGLADYEDGKKEADEEIADAQKKLDDAQAEVDDAQAELDDIDECEWYVLGRDTNMGIMGYGQDSERVGNLADIFPLIFFLVAALACLTTMTRMVEEQRTQIGALKAMGFSRLAISKKYIGYAFAASLIGGVLGLALGCTLIPLVIANAFNIMYNIPALRFKNQMGIYVFSVLAAVACTTGAALWACLSTLVDTPANLMRPRAPKPGKRVLLERITPLWNRLSFTWKVTMRNLFRYKKRFWMTVIGIGGCTALIVTGFGLHDSIFSILNRQFDEIFLYDATAGLDPDAAPEETALVEEYLSGSDSIEQYLISSESMAEASTDGPAYDVNLFAVGDMDQFTQFIRLRHRLDDGEVTLPEDGVIITEKLSELLGVHAGDTFTLEKDDERVTTVVADIVENYVQHYVYLSGGVYEELFGGQPEANVVLIRYNGDAGAEQSERVSVDLMEMDAVTSYSYIATIRDNFTNSMNAIDYAVMIVITSAAALAFVVLYNLTNINITERTRELATLKVLGFYDRETTAYVYRENIFLTIFGILLGLVLGRLLHSWLILTVEVTRVMFGRTAPPYAYVLAAVLTALFSVIVNIAAHFKLKKIDMVESLKTVE